MVGDAVNAEPTTQAPPGWTSESSPPVAQPADAAIPAPGGWSTLLSGLRRGFHPPLLLAWVVLLWVPAAMAMLPAALWLYVQTAHTPQAAALAVEATFLADALGTVHGEGAFLAAGSSLALSAGLLLSPWLSGMIVAQIRADHRLHFADVLRAGLHEYPCMLRMLLLSLFLMALASAAGVGALLAIEWDVMVPELGWLLPVLLALFVHVTVEAGRGWLGAGPALRSVGLAWSRGLALLTQRPGATMAIYAGTTLIGYGLALGFLYLRTLMDADGWGGWLLGCACVQFAVAAMAWGRSARLHGLADLATAQGKALPLPSPTAVPQRRKVRVTLR